MAPSEAIKYGVEVSEIWRLSRRVYAPMHVPPRRAQGAGRFDDPALSELESEGDYGVLYCGNTPRASFMETLSGMRDRLDARMDVLRHSIMEVDERDAFKREADQTGSVISKSWQSDWQLTGASVTTIAPVFDLTNSSAVQYVREQMAVAILALGHSDLDFSHLLSSNRALTQAISRWIWSMTNDAGDPLFAGIRYRSRFDPDCICIALYEDRYTVDGDIDIQPITPETPGFAEAANTLRLTIA